MRLLRRKSDGDLELVSFDVGEPPLYAILSHTWTAGEEVTYDELIAGQGRDKAGYQKIRSCGDMAARNDLHYFWVDTCCIDKRSSSELQEAINSMFKWYKKAVICYVYLNDVHDPKSIDGEDSQFHKSRWHTRGWTLQELLAPRDAWFYTHDWTFIGTKHTLIRQLNYITRIKPGILMGHNPVTAASVAQRMSWASQRETSRPEDMAYCLMGIFSVNMTMLYGEGQKAFMRLQEEICRMASDTSIFAWQNVENVHDWVDYGVLAPHPRYFKAATDVPREENVLETPAGSLGFQRPIAIVNQGIQMQSHLLTLRNQPPNIRILVLKCPVSTASYDDRGYLGILIRLTFVPDVGLRYARLRPDPLTLTRHLPASTQEILLSMSGRFENRTRRKINELSISRYTLGAVQPERLERYSLDLAPMYITIGDLDSWRLIAWTAYHRLYKPMTTDERRILGQVTFPGDDWKDFMIRLSIRKEIKTDAFFSHQITKYIGEGSWVEGSGSENWLSNRVVCGYEHAVYVANEGHSDATPRKDTLSFLDFPFVLRVRPNDTLD